MIPRPLAETLIDNGHLAVARRLAEDGDQECAVAVAQALLDRGDPETALAVAPSPATELVADILAAQGRLDEAVTLLRRRISGQYDATRLAGLLARNGRVDEAIALVTPLLSDFTYARCLVTVTAGAGRDDQVLALLRSPAGASFATLLAEVLERQGRVDEAIVVLRARPEYGEQLAGVLARAGREDELHAVLRADGSPRATAALAASLARQGRHREAVETLLAAGAEAEWLLDRLGDVLIDWGSADDASATLDRISEEADRGEGESADLRLLRCRLLVAFGRREEAITVLRAEPGPVTVDLAELLIAAGRTAEAVPLLLAARSDPWRAEKAGRLLIELGLVEEAVEPFLEDATAKRAAAAEKAAADADFWRRFARS